MRLKFEPIETNSQRRTIRAVRVHRRRSLALKSMASNAGSRVNLAALIR
jgi:hypothetical protein